MTKRKKHKKNSEVGKQQQKTGMNISVPGIIISALILISLFIFPNIFNDKNFTQIKPGITWLVYICLFIILLIMFFQDMTQRISIKNIQIIKISGLILIIILNIIGFYPLLQDNGDNTNYIIQTKSILQGNGVRLLHQPGKPLNKSLVNIGFTILLLPFVLIGDLNFIIMKMLPFLSTIFAIILLYIISKKYFSDSIAAIIALLFATNGMTVHFSSLILTENVFIMSALVAIYFFQHNIDSNTFINKYFWLSGITIFYSFLVRFIGIGFLGFAPLNLFYRKKYKKAIIFFIFLMILLVTFVSLQTYTKKMNSKSPVSEYEKAISNLDSTVVNMRKLSMFEFIKERLLKKNAFFRILKHCIFIIPQHAIGYKWKFDTSKILLLSIFLIFLAGIIYDILKRSSPLAFYIVGYIISLSFATMLDDKMVMARYLIPTIPFFYFFILSGIDFVSIYSLKYFNINKKYRNILLYLTSFIFFFCNLSTINFYIPIAQRDHNPAFNNYIKMSKWIKNNIDEKEIIGARKHRYQYIYSKHQAAPYYALEAGFSRYSKWSEKLGELTILKFEKLPMKYMIFDTFSGDSFGKLLPVMRKYPERFETVYSIGGVDGKEIPLPDRWWMSDQTVRQIANHAFAILIKYEK